MEKGGEKKSEGDEKTKEAETEQKEHVGKKKDGDEKPERKSENSSSGADEQDSTPSSSAAEASAADGDGVGLPTHGIDIYNATPTLLSTLFFPVMQDNDVLIIYPSNATATSPSRPSPTPTRKTAASKFDVEMQVVKDTLAKLDGVSVTEMKMLNNTVDADYFVDQVSLVARSRVLIGLYGVGLSQMLWGLPGRTKVGFFGGGGYYSVPGYAVYHHH